MAKAAQDIDDAASTIKGLQTSLNGHKQSVLAGWQGNAAHAFDAVFQSFDEDMTKVLTALGGMHARRSGAVLAPSRRLLPGHSSSTTQNLPATRAARATRRALMRPRAAMGDDATPGPGGREFALVS